MTLKLGIDTGGTYTDAVLLDPDCGVIAAAKALTTKHDLSIGIGEAIGKVIPKAEGRTIDLVSMSTTLATNAVVESHGRPVGLIMIGQGPEALERAGLKQALGSDPVAHIEGGHKPNGEEAHPLDLDGLLEAAQKMRERVSAFAIAGYFATRNPAHELKAREILRDKFGLPVTCAHELSSNLDAPRRALTALINARLVPLLHHLIVSIEGYMNQQGIDAPLMVVKGDGSLIAAPTALERPIETILSGPAASVVGARYLSSETDGFVVDMGGTTTDIAVIRDGRPMIDPEGATVSGWRTMVEAIAVRTVGLGGDSEIRINDDKELVAGPRRAVPLSLLARDHANVVPILKEQFDRGFRKTYDGRFALRLRMLDENIDRLSASELRIWESLGKGPVSLEALLGGRSPDLPLRRLVDRGLVILSAFTPSDAAHVLHMHDSWNREAAELGAAIWAKTEIRPGEEAATDAEAFAHRVLDIVAAQSCEAMCEAALDTDRPGTDLSRSAFSRWMLDRGTRQRTQNPPQGLLKIDVSLELPLIAAGAPVRTYYPDIAHRLGTRLVLPEHAEVTNAVGAVAGDVSQSAKVTITSPAEHIFRVHAPSGLKDFNDLDAAAAHATALAEELAGSQAKAAGAGDLKLKLDRKDKVVKSPGGKDIFLESEITATAYGRPALAVRTAAE